MESRNSRCWELPVGLCEQKALVFRFWEELAEAESTLCWLGWELAAPDACQLTAAEVAVEQVRVGRES